MSKPTHYAQNESGYDVISFTKEFSVGFVFGNLIKYLYRFGLKDARQKEREKIEAYIQACKGSQLAFFKRSEEMPLCIEEKLRHLFKPTFERLHPSMEQETRENKLNYFCMLITFCMVVSENENARVLESLKKEIDKNFKL